MYNTNLEFKASYKYVLAISWTEMIIIVVYIQHIHALSETFGIKTAINQLQHSVAAYHNIITTYSLVRCVFDPLITTFAHARYGFSLYLII